MRRTLILNTLLAGVCPFLAHAQTAPPGEGVAVSEVVVVADRAPTAIDQVGQSVTVLTDAQIRIDQGTAVSDLLARTPGVSISRNGGPGAFTGVFIRGAESEQTVVRIDGVAIDDPAAPGGGYDFGNLIAGEVARIEVLRGPQSTLYGSQAVGGVVDITTAEPQGPVGGDVRLEAGSYGTVYGSGGVGGAGPGYVWRLGGLATTTDGVSAFDRQFGGREADGFRQNALTGRLRLDLTPEVQLDQRAYWSHGRTEIDGNPPPSYGLADDAEYEITTQFVDYTGLNLTSFGGRLKSRLNFQYTAIEREGFDPSQSTTDRPSAFDGINRRIEYQGTAELGGGWRGVVGAQDEDSRFSESDFGSYSLHPAPLQASARIDSGYARLSGEILRGVSVAAGIRDDEHSAFGGHVTGQASAAWAFETGTVLRASWGGGFKAPTLYQLYSPYGSPELRPEVSDGWDGGVEQRWLQGRLDVQITAFGRSTRDQIGFFSCGPADPRCSAQPYGYYANIDRTRTTGVEAQGAWRVDETLNLTANYSHIESRDRSPGAATFGDRLPRRPADVANAAADYRWPGGLTTSAAVRFAGASFDDAANTVRLKSYALVDLRAHYPLRPDLEVYGRVENLFDRAYETAYRYGSLGRAAYVGLRARF